MKAAFASLVLLVALPVAAQELEQILLPVEPSVVLCGYNSRYETRLVAYNEGAAPVRALCANDACGAIGAKSGREIAGADSMVPKPTFLYLPKEQADRLRLSLIVEGGDRDHPEGHSYAELPIVRASDFRDSTLTFVGVRMDEGFRQTVRIFALDGNNYGAVQVRAYDLVTGELVYDDTMLLWPLSDERLADGRAMRPSFSMECDISKDIPANGHNIRLEIEPLTPGLKFWAFVSVTNNKTQQFYTVVPR